MEVYKGKVASVAFWALILSFSTLIDFSSGQQSKLIGVNYGKQGDNLGSPYESIEIMKSMQAGKVKLYDADPETLKLLAGTRIRASIMVGNEDIIKIASNETFASQWVRDNVIAYYPRTMIRYIMVGNQVYSNSNNNDPNTQWTNLVQAMQRIKNSLHYHDIDDIKISSPMSMNVLSSSFPPSQGSFQVASLSTMVPFLQFLDTTSSFFFINVYPYFVWSSLPDNINLDFALFQGNLTYTDPTSGLNYTNLLDQMLDAVHFALQKVGFPHIPIAISETGWPNQGDVDQHGVNVHNAATYNRNIVKKIVADPPIGTPARPGSVIPTFLYSLYNENLKKGSGIERHWGIVNPDGSPIYEIDLSGAKEEYEGALPRPTNNRPYRGQLWCVVTKFGNMSGLGLAFKEACKGLNGSCEDALGPGKACYEPVSLNSHASYAFNAFWVFNRINSTASCYFNGFASLTTTDPSHGSCKFPSVTV